MVRGARRVLAPPQPLQFTAKWIKRLLSGLQGQSGDAMECLL